MSNLIPFESAKLPAHLRAAAADLNNDLVSGGVGFPVLSIKGKVFTVKRSGEKTLIEREVDGDMIPAPYIEVVILKAGPEGRAAKTFYAKGFTEGSEDKPDCFSNDGLTPDAESPTPQHDKCSTCPKNQFGSRITEDNKKAKACGDAKRLAIAPVDQLNDPMMLRVPATSLKTLTEYANMLAKRGVGYQAVVTKIGFDSTLAHPALTFKPVGFVDEGTFATVQEQIQTDVVQQIVGAVPASSADEFETPKADAPKPAKPKAAAKPAPAGDDDLPKEKKAEVKVEGEDKPKAAAKPAPAVAEDDSDVDAMLDGIDFED